MSADPRIEAAIAGLDQAHLHATKNGTPLSDYLEALATAALAAADAVDPLRQPGHRAEVFAHSWTLQHPAECRANMLACPLNEAIRSMDPMRLEDGLWSVELDTDGYLAFLPEAEPDQGGS